MHGIKHSMDNASMPFDLDHAQQARRRRRVVDAIHLSVDGHRPRSYRRDPPKSVPVRLPSQVGDPRQLRDRQRVPAPGPAPRRTQQTGESRRSCASAENDFGLRQATVVETNRHHAPQRSPSEKRTEQQKAGEQTSCVMRDQVEWITLPGLPVLDAAGESADCGGDPSSARISSSGIQRAAMMPSSSLRCAS